MDKTSYLLLNGFFSEKNKVYSAIKRLLEDQLALGGTVKKSMAFLKEQGEIRTIPSYELTSVIHINNKDYIKNLLEDEYEVDFVCFTTIVDESKNLDSFLLKSSID